MRTDQVIGLWLFREYQREAKRPWIRTAMHANVLKKPRRGVVHLTPNHIFVFLWTTVVEFRR